VARPSARAIAKGIKEVVFDRGGYITLAAGGTAAARAKRS
jgi:ribosomal protein L18